MAAYLSLTEKATGKVYTGDGLIDLDNRICRELFNIEPDPKYWVHGWMDNIGMATALGVVDIVAKYEGYPEQQKIAQWLLDNFDNTSYYGR